MLKLRLPKIKEIAPRVFLVTMKNQFDLAMTFVRVQEYYESPHLAGKVFTFMEYMKYYAEKWGKPKGSYSYTDDINGFNVPGHVIKDCFASHFKDGDHHHEYDRLMDAIINRIQEKLGCGNWDFYLIGVHTGQGRNKKKMSKRKVKKERQSLLSHEIAHGLYYTNQSYHKKVDKLLREIPKLTKKYMIKALMEKGYAMKTALDEINSYLATGLENNMKPSKFKKELPLFFNLLKEYYPPAVQYHIRYKTKKQRNKK